MKNETKNTSLDNKKLQKLGQFQKATRNMIATNNKAYKGEWVNRFWTAKTREYSLEEVQKIINSGSLSAQRKLSNAYYKKGGFYTRILTYYATLYKYIGILVPNPAFGKDLSTDFIQKRYHNAVNFIEKISVPTFCQDCALKAVTEGCYYGVIQTLDKDNFTVLDLPSDYCSSRFKDKNGNDLIEFDVRFFDKISDTDTRRVTLQVYPKPIRNWYKRWKDGKVQTSWVNVPSEIGICFPFYQESPLFLNTIPAILNYEDSVEVEKERDIEEIKKIVVQHIPHTADGELVFEPDEAEEMHRGAVEMLKKNENVSVLTSYADVDSIVSKTSADTASNNLEKMMNNIYYEASASNQLFAATSNLSLSVSIENDMALMSNLVHKFENFITNLVNRLYANSNITFKYTILPITPYNAEKYADSAFKFANSGYSFLLPALALGLSQRDLGNIKTLENDVLELGKKLIPLASAYTQSAADGAGRPEKPLEEKSQKTIQNEKSLEKQGQGGSN